jgi:hypothetical protein
MKTLSSMEHRLTKAQESNEDEKLEEDDEMRRRINVAKLVSSTK